jgi:Fe2+ transport system protein FeoA
MKKHSIKKLVFIAIFISGTLLLSGYFLIKPAFKYLSGYLSKSEQVKANILIVEGWLPDYALKIAYEEYQKNGYEYIITTGLKFPNDYYRLTNNGYLIFYPKNRFRGINVPGTHSIEVDAFSEMAGENRAHFNLFINDTVIGNFYSEKRRKRYRAAWNGYLSKVDSIMVQFDNDKWSEVLDRNLYVKDIIIDHRITIPYFNNSEYAILTLDKKQRIINNFNSYAESARNRLLSMGMVPSKIIAAPGEKVIINRTLTSALAFRDCLKMTNIDIKGINIISMGTHARRTWMTYNKILNEKYIIGIISISDYTNKSGIRKFLKTVRETLGIIYYWIILIPY